MLIKICPRMEFIIRKGVCPEPAHGENMLTEGVKGKKIITVTQEQTARVMGSGTLDVYATPSMIALMENTAFESVEKYLETGCGTVGTSIEVKHVAATPVGMKVVCETELIEVDGRRLVFKLQAMDERGLIGEGLHERFIIQEEKFQEKANRKLE